jgi:hypothetical protein
MTKKIVFEGWLVNLDLPRHRERSQPAISARPLTTRNPQKTGAPPWRGLDLLSTRLATRPLKLGGKPLHAAHGECPDGHNHLELIIAVLCARLVRAGTKPEHREFSSQAGTGLGDHVLKKP